MGRILGINTRYYPSQTNRLDPPATVAVLVEGAIGDYAVYVGHGSPEWVAQYGDKISFQEAQVQFGALIKENYRD